MYASTIWNCTFSLRYCLLEMDVRVSTNKCFYILQTTPDNILWPIWYHLHFMEWECSSGCGALVDRGLPWQEWLQDLHRALRSNVTIMWNRVQSSTRHWSSFSGLLCTRYEWSRTEKQPWLTAPPCRNSHGALLVILQEELNSTVSCTNDIWLSWAILDGIQCYPILFKM